MSQKSSASTASTPSNTPGSKYSVTEDHLYNLYNLYVFAQMPKHGKTSSFEYKYTKDTPKIRMKPFFPNSRIHFHKKGRFSRILAFSRIPDARRVPVVNLNRLSLLLRNHEALSSKCACVLSCVVVVVVNSILKSLVSISM